MNEHPRVSLQPAAASDLPAVHELVQQSEALTQHSKYTYWLALDQWPHLFLVVKSKRKLIGFTFGLMTFEHSRRAFLWQIGVAQKYRRSGVARELLTEFCMRSYQ